MAKETDKVPLNLRVKESDKKRWKDAAEADNRTLTSYVIQSCDERAARILPLHPEPDYDSAA